MVCSGYCIRLLIANPYRAEKRYGTRQKVNWVKNMRIAGVEKSSFIDYPEKICTVFFTLGCNFRCSYCHNSSLVLGQGEEITEAGALDFIVKRKKYVDAICISGGEPTLQNNLYEFIKKIKIKKFLVKLDTNGTNPQILDELVRDNLVDYIAMDIKAPLHKYELVTDCKVDTDAIAKSIEIIKKSGVDYEFRTTLCKELLSPDDIFEIAGLLKGSDKYYMQNFKDGDTVLAGKGRLTPYDLAGLQSIKNKIKNNFKTCDVR